MENPKIGERVKLNKKSEYYLYQGLDANGREKIGVIEKIMEHRIHDATNLNTYVAFQQDVGHWYNHNDLDRLSEDYIKDWEDTK